MVTYNTLSYCSQLDYGLKCVVRQKGTATCQPESVGRRKSDNRIQRISQIAFPLFLHEGPLLVGQHYVGVDGRQQQSAHYGVVVIDSYHRDDILCGKKAFDIQFAFLDHLLNILVGKALERSVLVIQARPLVLGKDRVHKVGIQLHIGLHGPGRQPE